MITTQICTEVIHVTHKNCRKMKCPVKPNFMTTFSFICVSNGFVIGVIEQYFDFKDASLSKIGQYSIELILHVPCGLLFQIDYDLHSCFVHSETNTISMLTGMIITFIHVTYRVDFLQMHYPEECSCNQL